MTHDPPAIRASDAERDQTVERLRAHAVEGRLTLEEFAQRIEAAYTARSRDELDELTRDLPADGSRAVEQPAKRRRRLILAVLGGSTQRGRFRVPAETTAVAFLGGADIDLRQAEIEAAEVTLTTFAFLGGVNVTVPEGVDVDVEGFALLGGKNFEPGKVAPPAGAPRLRVRAFAFLGGVNVEAKPPRR